MITIERTFSLAKRPHGRSAPAAVPAPTTVPGRVPRISRLMALAIRFERLLCEGGVRDQSELARLAHVTQPRMTQILNLLHLAPDIQEELLFLPRVTVGKDPITERDIRPITAFQDWRKQRRVWAEILQCQEGQVTTGSVSPIECRA